MSDDDEFDFWEELSSKWWGELGMGVFFLIAAGVAFWHLTNVEQAGENVGRTSWYVKLAYMIGGKWAASGILALIGLILSSIGIYMFLHRPVDDD